ncbi:bifunctional folylpolyglutamate synthase/dihydrofolate synthase [Anaerophaga thermohalophila]|jgi:dihydrofolate synthase/folylpolyglutamate synthase|uniref:bifunctional folylpolyglutamate synthase/dihydrofolate synthase n=1 Tax=Anaerophaga thermohalophila TaxID=177400 RepID=UPI0003154C01|nr:folylpolyglutamate synthase/dihydrofolate synthase family protein [Anaerophaga thermohalophila]
MTYQETIKYLFEQLPVYQRSGKAAYKADLKNTLELDNHFGHPHRRFRTIHVAGTNGKGSVSHLLASILQSAGYRTGLYTSPHLLDFRERIRINGRMIPEKEVIDFVAVNRDIIDRIHPSFFEMTVALAFDYFYRAEIDVAVIEVGLGGRLDSTNIITPDLSVITNIGMDHTMFLGNTLSAIAGEKAGIIKNNVPVVIGRRQEEIADVFCQKAKEMKSPIYFASQMIGLKKVREDDTFQHISVASDALSGTFRLPLLGNYQQENLLTVLASVVELREAGYSVTDSAIHRGIEKVTEQTGLAGRWQVISRKPLVVCDTGHNADGIERISAQLKLITADKTHIVWGMVDDKDVQGIMKLLPQNALYYFTRASIPRAMDEHILGKLAGEAGLKGETYPDVSAAVAAARENASDNDLIFIGGSTFIVAEALEK